MEISNLFRLGSLLITILLIQVSFCFRLFHADQYKDFLREHKSDALTGIRGKGDNLYEGKPVFGNGSSTSDKVEKTQAENYDNSKLLTSKDLSKFRHYMRRKNPGFERSEKDRISKLTIKAPKLLKKYEKLNREYEKLNREYEKKKTKVDQTLGRAYDSAHRAYKNYVSVQNELRSLTQNAKETEAQLKATTKSERNLDRKKIKIDDSQRNRLVSENVYE